ncbi:MAG: LacI family DNA-binding transcriptional regulator [Proteobacteria bacterium]|nr:LacI family DNA-binding transcriptional regulator [Pseudomonadota bacterium]
MASTHPPLPTTRTLKELAQRSGISAATLSRVLNHPELVRPVLRGKAQAALAQAGYVPHGAARSLASRRTRTIGVVVPTVDSALFAKVLEGLQQRLHRTGYQLFVANSAYSPGREAEQVRALVERGVDGMALVGSTHDAGMLELLRARRIPFVTTCHHDPGAAWPTIGWDNVVAAERLADYLLDIGHRRFAVIAGVMADNDRATQRVQGFRRAVERRGGSLPTACVIEKPYTVLEARRAMAALLRRPQRPTAVLCGNDILAFGALQECLWQDVAVPQQISITGFDDIEMAAHCRPGITTLHVPALEIGSLAAAALLATIDGRAPADGDEHVCLELELILRGTTAPPSGNRPAAPPARPPRASPAMKENR